VFWRLFQDLNGLFATLEGFFIEIDLSFSEYIGEKMADEGFYAYIGDIFGIPEKVFRDVLFLDIQIDLHFF
jgi:hypothetical protein